MKTTRLSRKGFFLSQKKIKHKVECLLSSVRRELNKNYFQVDSKGANPITRLLHLHKSFLLLGLIDGALIGFSVGSRIVCMHYLRTNYSRISLSTMG